MNYLRLLVLISVGVLSYLPTNGSASSWFNWSGWSACSSPLCSGTQERYRSCNNFFGRGKCVGPRKQCRFGELQFGQTCYFYIHEASGYPDAQQLCQENKDGSHLVHMTSSCLYQPLLQYARVQHSRAYNPEQRIYFFTWLGGTYETYSKSDEVNWSDGRTSSIQSYWFPNNPQIIQYFPETTYLRLQISMDENDAFQGIFNWPLCQNCAFPFCQFASIVLENK